MVKKELFKELKGKYTNRRLVYLAVAFIAVLLFITLENKGFLSIPEAIINATGLILFSILTIFIATILIKFTEQKIFNGFRKEVQIEQRIFVTKLYTISIYVVALSLILWKIGVSLESITLFVGLIATGIAFAIRDIIVSFIAWFIILVKRPFKIGDEIDINSVDGIVERIGTFYVTISNNKRLIRIPNKIFLEKNLINMGREITSQKIDLFLTSLPKNSQELLSKLEQEIQEITQYSANISIKVDKGNWMLSIGYQCKQEESKKNRQEILIVMYNSLKDSIMLQKE